MIDENLDVLNNFNEKEKKIFKELEVISDLLTNICEESTQNYDSNNNKIK